MRENAFRRIGLATTIVAGTIVARGALSAEGAPVGEPIAVEAAALVPLDEESTLSIVGLRGQITIEGREARELRVVSRELGPKGAELPVGIWQEGTTMILAAAPGAKDVPHALRISVPRTFAVTLDAVDSNVSVDSAVGGVQLRGKNSRVHIRAIEGFVSAELEGGSLTVSASGDATLRLRGTALEVADMSGNVNVMAVGGSLSLRGIRGSTDVESDESKVTLDDLAGSMRLKAQRGDATVTGLKAGAELELSETPLHLKDGSGDITVISDAPVDFQTMAASLHFDMYGGSLRGTGNRGILEVRTRNTEVNVASIDEGMRVQGNGLNAKIADIAGELYIETKISEVTIERVGRVILNIDRGNVTVHGAQEVQANVTGGDVHLIDVTGPVTLDLDRGNADVSWASLPGEMGSKLVNTSGNITARFPVAGVGRVEAKSSSGFIDTDLPAVKVDEDRTQAQGPINSGSRPLISITANGDIHLLSASGSSDTN
jgi:DUF4097 and DUF4098 domain-containing protein YvlB